MGKILILGGTGAMGVFLVKRLSVSHEVYVTSRQPRTSSNNVKYIQGNALEYTFLKSVLNMRRWGAIIDFMSYNTEDFKRRYNEILASTDQYIYLSSSRVYANSVTPLTEDSKRLLDVSNDRDYLRSDDYALAKARQEDLLRNSGKSNWTCIRPYMTYDTYRLDLGYFPKELWLYRVLKGRIILFPKDVATKYTTLTYGDDVAKRIALLVENPEAIGKIFQITQQRHYTWKEIIDLYATILRRKGYEMNVKYVDALPIKEPIYIYDRVYDRVFNSSRIERISGDEYYVDVNDGLNECLNSFLTSPRFKTIDWKKQAYWDKILKEHTALSEIPNLSQRVLYLLFRYVVPYQFVWKILQFAKRVKI